MAVENTKSLLNKLVEMSRLQFEQTPVNLQQNLLYNQVKHHFPTISKEEFHYELLMNGLFDPSEIGELETLMEQLCEKNVWGIVHEEYEKLKGLWNGMDCPIYIYPLTNNRPKMEGIVANKNGLTFQEAIFLFVSPELEKKELQGMIAHEYNHFCRLNVLNVAPEEIPLKESIILEGLAECAVEDLYGKEWCSPWISNYPFKELKKKWKKYYVRALHLKGVNNHQRFLYGDGSKHFPYWIGYCLGYVIVKSYLERNRVTDQQMLFSKTADEIIANSDFNLK